MVVLNVRFITYYGVERWTYKYLNCDPYIIQRDTDKRFTNVAGPQWKCAIQWDNDWIILPKWWY